MKIMINGDKIKTIRGAKGISQRKLALISGVALQTVQRAETGYGGGITVATLHKIAQALGMPMAYFLSD